MMTYISGIPSKDIDKVWHICSPFIELAAEKGREEMTPQNIYEFCKEAKMQLWVIYNEKTDIIAVITTEIIEYPAKKVCRIVTLGGSGIDAWLDYISVIESWAVEKECKAIETFCRKGFIKKLENYGYEQTYVVLGKELSSVH